MSLVRALSLFALCALVHHASGLKKQVDCPAQKVELDSAVNNMTMMMNDWELGYETLDEFNDDYCTPFTDWFKVFNGYKPCLKAFPRTLFAFVGTNIRKFYKSFCHTEEKKVDGFNRLKCFNPETKPLFRRISADIKNFADFVSNLPNIDDLIPTFCCGYMNITEEYEEMMEAACIQQGFPGSGHFIMGIVRALLVDAVDMMCGKYSKKEDCRDPSIATQLDNMYVAGKNRTSFPFKSPVVPVLVILDRMDGKVNID